MILEQEFHSTVTILLIRNTGCFGIGACGKFNTVVWQGYCGCWAFKCLNCANTEYSSCTGRTDDSHWEEFEEAAQALT